MTTAELTEARHRLGLTQSALEAAIGVTAGYLSKMERGSRPIEIRTALAIRALCILGADPAQWPDMRSTGGH